MPTPLLIQRCDLPALPESWYFQEPYPSQSARLLVKVSSDIGAQKGWRRAGSLAQVLVGLPTGDPKKSVQRLYLDEVFIELDGRGYGYYLEFWPVCWLADYHLEIWAQQAFVIGVPPGQTEPFSIGGEPFTIDGVPLVI
ncbi:MAG: hypothetical protein ABG776_07435 [Cyanobacteria bacterium J06555_13]